MQARSTTSPTRGQLMNVIIFQIITGLEFRNKLWLMSFLIRDGETNEALLIT